MMTDIKKRGLDSLISQNSHSGNEINEGTERYTKTVGFKVTERQYETYKRYSKYFGSDDLIKKWRSDLDRIEREKGKDMESVETEIRKRLTK
ncbi:MAG: hypothetical protein AMDU1_APLC00072G0002 [Thermoplasmatales archaeon A-plasma]|jgi:hypothetical protein|nr:MAG: hypothetical protein AMDU1_APLC00072G0002 [Thermoplasmatales archaeon A-plasma]